MTLQSFPVAGGAILLPGIKLRRSAAQSFNHGSAAPIVWTVQDYVKNGFPDQSSVVGGAGLINVPIPVTGIWLAELTASWANNAAGVRSIYLYTGTYVGGTRVQPISEAGSSTVQTCTAVTFLTAGQTINAGGVVTTTVGGTLNLEVNDNAIGIQTHLALQLLTPA